MTSYTDMLAHPDTSTLPSLALARPGIINGINHARRQQMTADEARDDAVMDAYDVSGRIDAQRLRRLLILDTIRCVGEKVSAKWICRELELQRSLVYDDLRTMVAEGKLQSVSSAKNKRGYTNLLFWSVP